MGTVGSVALWISDIASVTLPHHCDDGVRRGWFVRRQARRVGLAEIAWSRGGW